MKNTVKFNKGNVKMIAHRGLSGIEAENTSAAFVAAGNRSYWGIETDIHKTADGFFVTNHDGNLARVGGVEMSVGESTLAELQSVVLFDKDGTTDRADLRVPTLENYLAICKKYSKHAVLEIKGEFSEDDITRVIEIIRGFDYLENVTFISFTYANLKRVRAALPEQSVEYLFSELTNELIERLIADNISVDARHSALTAEAVKRFHDAGLTVNCWTVDDPVRAEELVKMGIDQITSNILE